MSGNILSMATLGALALLLVSAGVEDARKREIANWKNAVIAGLAPLWWYANGAQLWPDIAMQLGLGLGVFALFCAAFYFGQMGGGDVKLIGALALWLPLQPLIQMLVLMSLIGGGLTIIMLIEHKLRKSNRILEIPYGVAIAMAALIAIREPVFNHFT
ncbi:MAG: prepilin peptidase [Sphingomonas sp.]|jgi:prepilin peptidase CpaA